jgi:(R,R)-butanediol dehydrogenase/meso-butanediol dehydrogenase/diacetyl reductase/L-iditol 2-dehydrogenase
MKAVVVKKVGIVEVQDVPEPEPEPDQIKVKIAYAGICGSDPKIVASKGMPEPLEGAIGWPQKTPPIPKGVKILGHEASGTIVKIGKNVKGDFKIGQPVAMNFRKSCGGCYYCENKMEHFCERATSFMGVMADYAVFSEGLVYPLPDDLPLDVGAFLEPVSVAVHTLDIACIKTGDSVIITGGGTIGLLVLQLAIKSGASKVLVSEPIAEKRQLAKQLGADVVVNPLSENLLAISNKLTDGRGFNVCIEESGIPSIARQLILLAERCGTIVWAATYPSNLDVGVPIEYMYGRELSIHSVLISPYSFPRAVQMLSKLDLKPLITVYPLREVIQALEAHKIGKGVKIMLQP